MNVNISLTSSKLEARKHMCLRVLVCGDVTTDLIIGLPSIKHFNLLPILNDHISTIQCCEICLNIKSDSQLATDPATGNRGRRWRREATNKARYTGIGTQSSTIPTQHSSYTGEMATLFAEINSIMEIFDTPTYNDPDELIQALQGLHLSEILEFADDSADEDGQNDIGISRMNTSSDNNDYTMGGSEKIQARLTDLITECQGALHGHTTHGIQSR